MVLLAPPDFYHQPRRVAQLVDFIVQRIVDQLVPTSRSCPGGRDRTSRPAARMRLGIIGGTRPWATSARWRLKRSCGQPPNLGVHEIGARPVSDRGYERLDVKTALNIASSRGSPKDILRRLSDSVTTRTTLSSPSTTRGTVASDRDTPSGDSSSKSCASPSRWAGASSRSRTSRASALTSGRNRWR